MGSVAAEGELTVGEHDKCEPWPETGIGRRADGSGRRYVLVGAVGGDSWREHPREAGVVELDAGQVVRLEVRRQVSGVCSDHVARIETDHVAGTVQLHRSRNRDWTRHGRGGGSV